MSLTILQGDALEKLRELPDESVQSCVTSPPYWALRDYGMAGQIGLEETPDAYVAKMVEVFREVRRVLRNDGTLWLNLGDSYAGSMKGSFKSDDAWNASQERAKKNGYSPGIRARTAYNCSAMSIRGLKPKDLVGIPWMVAFALRADGWYLRSDIIWHKPNPMPESVTDRPTKAHEYLFLLTKSERYCYDAEAIRENALKTGTPAHLAGGRGTRAGTREGLKPKGKWSMEDKQSSGRRIVENVAAAMLNGAAHDNPFGLTRNKRSVWTVATVPYSDAHFATYPPDLIKPCILAGTKAGDTVLDPFAGSGTTGMVAIELGRKAILIELNPAYVTLIERRCDVTPGLPL